MNDKLEAYLAQFDTALERGRHRTALQEIQRFDGSAYNRFKYAEEHLADFDRIDWAKGRVYKKDGVFFDVKHTTKTFAKYVEFLLAARESERIVVRLPLSMEAHGVHRMTEVDEAESARQIERAMRHTHKA